MQRLYIFVVNILNNDLLPLKGLKRISGNSELEITYSKTNLYEDRLETGSSIVVTHGSGSSSGFPYPFYSSCIASCFFKR